MAYALETRNLQRRFGGIVATSDLSLKVEQGARHALIGPNGAGKTTIINLLTGVLRPDAGEIRLGDADITRLAAHVRVRRGIARTFQINQLFPDLTPREAIGIAVSERMGQGSKWWRTGSRNDDFAFEVAALLERFGLEDVGSSRASAMPYGKQRSLEIALAVACKPRVLLLDEPAAGVPEAEKHELLGIIAALPADVTVLLVDHDMNLVFSFADRITVLVNGAVFAEGPPEAVAADPRVKAVYLGEEVHGVRHG